VFGAAGETETTQENIQDWLELDEGNAEDGKIKGETHRRTESKAISQAY
jgi:hypothetical protein